MDMVDSSRWPPCVVLGLETQIGLNAVRELGRAGVRVIGIAQDPSALGLGSRYLWRKHTVNIPRSSDLLRLLRSIAQEHGACPLLAISEVNLSWISEHASEIQPLKPLMPPASALAIALNKKATLAAAAEIGIETLRTWQPQSIGEIAELAPSFPLPAVLKWADPNRIAPRLSELGLSLEKAIYVNTSKELASALAAFNALGEWPLVQEYAKGYGLGQFFYIKHGVAKRRFQHRRVAEWPPEGGASSVCDAVPLEEHRELQERSIDLLAAIGWQGVAMVEYRHDPETGRSCLMEINGRLWGSFPLAVHCGAKFALLGYLDGIGSPIDEVIAGWSEPKSGLRCRQLTTELKRLHRILFDGHAIRDQHFRAQPGREVWRFLSDFLALRVRYYVASWGDPFPLFIDLRNMLLRR